MSTLLERALIVENIKREPFYGRELVDCLNFYLFYLYFRRLTDV